MKKLEKESFTKAEEEDGKLVGDGTVNSMDEFFTMYQECYPNSFMSKMRKDLDFDVDEYSHEESVIRMIHLDVKKMFEIGSLEVKDNRIESNALNIHFNGYLLKS